MPLGTILLRSFDGGAVVAVVGDPVLREVIVFTAVQAVASTILTLVVLPTMYEILDDWRLKLKGMFKIPERPKTEEYMIPRELRESAPKPSH